MEDEKIITEKTEEIEDVKTDESSVKIEALEKLLEDYKTSMEDLKKELHDVKVLNQQMLLTQQVSEPSDEELFGALSKYNR